MLDGLLAYAVSVRDKLPPALDASQVVPIEIPIERAEGGRFHLCTSARFEVEQHERRWLNRRFPIPEAQIMGNAKVRSINIAGGPCKSYRIPLHCAHLVDDEIAWLCLGDLDAISELLGLISHLGKRRGVGLGKVVEWRVEQCDSWDEGFPIVRDGQPQRPLPHDWPGLDNPMLAQHVLSYPYWRHTEEEPCAVPS